MKQLASRFRDYLAFDLDVAAGIRLAGSLADAGLAKEAQALQAHLTNASGLTSWRWDGRPCTISASLPPNPNPGDVWFDAVEITPMIMCPHPRRPTELYQASWVALHPVQYWQFRAFLELVKVGHKRTEFPHAPDYMDPARFAQQPPLSFVTNVYHDEALAYTAWFGKSLCGARDLDFARSLVSPAEFQMVLPEGLRLWDASEYSGSEFVRRAIGLDTIDKDENDEADLLESGENLRLPDRMLFDEWERRADIGFASSVSPGFPMTNELQHSLFFDLENSASRPLML